MSSHPKRLAALYLGLVFLAGTVFGYAVNEFYNEQTLHAKSTDEEPKLTYEQRLIQSLDEQLHLDDDQVDEILVILDDIVEKWHAVRDAMEPEFEALRRERASRIMAVLSPVQQAIYDEILQERERLRKEKEARHFEEVHGMKRKDDGDKKLDKGAH